MPTMAPLFVPFRERAKLSPLEGTLVPSIFAILSFPKQAHVILSAWFLSFSLSFPDNPCK
jgi:hypothetical protein